MTFWTAIQLIIKFGPQFWALLMWLKEKVEQGISEEQIRLALKDFDKGLDKALATKDTSDLEDIFRGKKP
jgi:hypothetical protein